MLKTRITLNSLLQKPLFAFFIFILFSLFLSACSSGVKTAPNKSSSSSTNNSTKPIITTNTNYYLVSNTFETITNNLLNVFYSNSYTLIKENNNITSNNINNDISSNLVTVKVTNGILKNDITNNNIIYKNNTSVSLFENGNVRQGTLKNNTVINGVTLSS